MELAAALLESWDRECRIVNAVAERIDESVKEGMPSPDGWPIYKHLAHIHQVRRFHLDQLDADRAAALEGAFPGGWQYPVSDMEELRRLLGESEVAVRGALHEALAAGKGQVGGYDHPVFFLQHLIFHEGWHIALIFLALRLAGQEPPEEWEEARVWGEWRTD